MKYKVGIDLGSTAIKIVIVSDQKIAWKKAAPTLPGQEAFALEMMREGLEQLAGTRADVERIAVTGYGRSLIAEAQVVIDEVSANAWGAFLLSGGEARTVINIGGQDIKIISIDGNGNLMNFKMNDKCAAGTGRFFEIAGRILDTPVDEFGAMAEKADDPVNLNSTCVVFAESEIVSLMAKDTKKENIIQGLHESVARRIAAMMGEPMLADDVYMDGGSANNPALVQALEDEIFHEVHVLPAPQFTVAYGAACFLKE